jgi:hypothetical protein
MTYEVDRRIDDIDIAHELKRLYLRALGTPIEQLP